MGISILEAIKLGQWDYEPEVSTVKDFSATLAMPGSDEKLNILAERLTRGLPLWHPSDRLHYQMEEDRRM